MSPQFLFRFYRYIYTHYFFTPTAPAPPLLATPHPPPAPSRRPLPSNQAPPTDLLLQLKQILSARGRRWPLRSLPRAAPRRGRAVGAGFTAPFPAPWPGRAPRCNGKQDGAARGRPAAFKPAGARPPPFPACPAPFLTNFGSSSPFRRHFRVRQPPSRGGSPPCRPPAAAPGLAGAGRRRPSKVAAPRAAPGSSAGRFLGRRRR